MTESSAQTAKLRLNLITIRDRIALRDPRVATIDPIAQFIAARWDDLTAIGIPLRPRIR